MISLRGEGSSSFDPIKQLKAVLVKFYLWHNDMCRHNGLRNDYICSSIDSIESLFKDILMVWDGHNFFKYNGLAFQPSYKKLSPQDILNLAYNITNDRQYLKDLVVSTSCEISTNDAVSEMSDIIPMITNYSTDIETLNNYSNGAIYMITTLISILSAIPPMIVALPHVHNDLVINSKGNVHMNDLSHWVANTAMVCHAVANTLQRDIFNCDIKLGTCVDIVRLPIMDIDQTTGETKHSILETFKLIPCDIRPY